MPRPHRRWPVVALAVLLAGCGAGGGGGAPAAAGEAVVTRVVDGDTIVVRLAGADERVRLIGIDTPESVDPRRPVQCFGREASARMKQLLPAGTRVRLERDAEARDRFDRRLAYVHRVRDGMFVNLQLVEEGFAQPLTIPPNVAHTDEFVAAAAAARDAGRGLWSRCETDPPDP